MSEKIINPLQYYSTHSLFSDPDVFSKLYDSLPDRIDDLCRVIQGLCLHYMQGSLYGYDIPADRLCEIDTRYTKDILAKIAELDSSPLTVCRKPDKRFIGCCHDFALLLCSVLRHRGVPARVRAGFAGYFKKWDPDFHCDHIITEFREAGESRWRRCDPELDAIAITENDVDFDPCDMPHDRFISGAQAWHLCHAGKADPDTFGVSARGTMKGLHFVLGALVHDLAALNRMELLNWDAWGLKLDGDAAGKEDTLSLLDQAAVLAEGGGEHFSAMRDFYKGQIGFRVPEKIMCFSPAAGAMELTLRH